MSTETNIPAEDQHGCELNICSKGSYDNCEHRSILNSEYRCNLLNGYCGNVQKIKPLVQYLDEYIEHEEDMMNIEISMYAYNSWRELLEQALDAYESTEDVKVRIEKV